MPKFDEEKSTSLLVQVSLALIGLFRILMHKDRVIEIGQADTSF